MNAEISPTSECADPRVEELTAGQGGGYVAACDCGAPFERRWTEHTARADLGRHCMNEAAAIRELHFTFEIVTELGENDEIKPTVEYVADWLNDNGYGYVEIGKPKVVRWR